eukprot:UN02097
MMIMVTKGMNMMKNKMIQIYNNKNVITLSKQFKMKIIPHPICLHIILLQIHLLLINLLQLHQTCHQRISSNNNIFLNGINVVFYIVNLWNILTMMMNIKNFQCTNKI